MAKRGRTGPMTQLRLYNQLRGLLADAVNESHHAKGCPRYNCQFAAVGEPCPLERTPKQHASCSCWLGAAREALGGTP